MFPEILFGVQFKFCGESLPFQNRNEPTIIISNHRTRLDWLFLWSFLIRFGNLAQEKITLKYELKTIFGAGWAMQHFCYMFLRRKWEEDEPYLTRVLVITKGTWLTLLDFGTFQKN
jgi:lysocardiolipin and lysophospholipid acyltransferase